MNCPDCKVKMEIKDYLYVDHKGDGRGYEIPIYICPKCDREISQEDII